MTYISLTILKRSCLQRLLSLAPQTAALLFLIFSFTASCATNPRNQQREITVAAAADLLPPFEELGKEFENQAEVKVILSFGSSALLAKQIENGAPMDVFAAASVDYINNLEKKGLILSDTKALFARGRITLWVRKESPLTIETVSDLVKPEVKRLAIANPDHAPYGLAARQALEAAGIWEQVRPKIVYGDNIRQTLQYAETGNVEVAIVALSLSLQSDGRWVLIPAELHKPIDQALAVIKGTKKEPDARRFADFVSTAFGRTVMRKYGFVLPDEEQ